MKPIVLTSFRDFTSKFEGIIHYMYCDVEGYVTTGIGNLIDPLVSALSLQWVRKSDQTPATQEEIVAEWHRVKDGRIPASPYGSGAATLVLTDDGITEVVQRRLNQNETYLARRWANWEVIPADGQMALHSNAWAAGSAWQAPALDAAIARLDFNTCSGSPGDANGDPSARGEAWLRDSKAEDEAIWRAGGTVPRWPAWGPSLNPGLRPRNLANKVLLRNSAVVLADGRDPNVLYWPTELDG